MTPYVETHEVGMRQAPLSRMANLIFDDRPAAIRGSLQVVVAVLIGALMGNALHYII